MKLICTFSLVYIVILWVSVQKYWNVCVYISTVSSIYVLYLFLNETNWIWSLSCLLQFPKNPAAGSGSVSNNDETEFLHSLLHISKRTKIFDHPVTDLFMKLKYRNLRWVILVSAILHVSCITALLNPIVFFSFYMSWNICRSWLCSFTPSLSSTCTLTSVPTTKIVKISPAVQLTRKDHSSSWKNCTQRIFYGSTSAGDVRRTGRSS
jgi:hypothetical protein